MNPFSAIGNFFKKIGQLIGKAFQAASDNGLTDAIVAQALAKVKQLATSALTNAERREQAVSFLIGRGIPESIARLAVELAVQLAKKELDKVPGA